MIALTPIFWLRLRLYRARDGEADPVAPIVLLGGDGPSRAETAIRAYRGQPVIVSGAGPETVRRMRAAIPEADLIVDALARTTRQNATCTALLIGAHDLPRQVVLVTDDWHMPRARMLFKRAGLTVVPLHHRGNGRSPWWSEARKWARAWWD